MNLDTSIIKVVIMLKIIFTIILLFFFVACDDKSVDTNETTVSSPFNPIKILDIKYENKSGIRTLAVDADIYAVSNGDDSITIGKLHPTGYYEKYSTIDINSSARYGVLISIDKSYVLLGDKSPDKISLYKILEDKSVKKVTDIDVESLSSLTYAGNMQIKDSTIAVSELRDYVDENTFEESSDHKVVIYRVESNESVTRVQELKSNLVDVNASSLFGEDFVLTSDTLAVAERCYIHLFQKDENGTFTRTDSKIFADSNSDDECYLHLSMKDKHLVAQSHNLSRVFFYQLDNFKFKTSQEIIPEIRYRNFGIKQAFIDDKLILSSSEGLTIYTIEDLESESTLTKYSDINVSADVFASSDKYFLATKARGLDVFSVFDAYPLSQIFVYNDLIAGLEVDEGEIYSIVSIDANSPFGELSFSLSGVDATYFELSANSLLNTELFDFENPVDSDMNNIYEIILTIRDDFENQVDVNIQVTVVDREFAFVTNVFTVDDSNVRELGRDIFIDGSDVLVSADNSAYLFDSNNSLKQILKFNSLSTQSDSKFGNSVAKDGLVVLIGDFLEDINATDQGSVTLFTLEDNKSIKSQIKIVSPLLEEFALFGQALDIENNITAISAPGYGYSYRGYSKVFVYINEVNGSLTFTQSIESGDAQQLEYFGSSLDLDGEYLLVGSPGHSFNNATGVGAAYLYKRQANNSYKIVDALSPNTTLYGQYFGSTVAMSGEYMVIGAPNAGDVYIFKLDISGEHADRVTTIHNDTLYRFGTDVSIKGKDIFIANADTTTDRIDHYKIEDNGTIILRETIINHSSVTGISSYSSIAQGKDFVVSGASGTVINETNSGLITLFKK